MYPKQNMILIGIGQNKMSKLQSSNVKNKKTKVKFNTPNTKLTNLIFQKIYFMIQTWSSHLSCVT